MMSSSDIRKYLLIGISLVIALALLRQVMSYFELGGITQNTLIIPIFFTLTFYWGRLFFCVIATFLYLMLRSHEEMEKVMSQIWKIFIWREVIIKSN